MSLDDFIEECRKEKEQKLLRSKKVESDIQKEKWREKYGEFFPPMLPDELFTPKN